MPVSEEEVEAGARAMEPGAFITFDRGYTCMNALAERAFLNAERTVNLARKKARRCLLAAFEARQTEALSGEETSDEQQTT